GTRLGGGSWPAADHREKRRPQQHDVLHRDDAWREAWCRRSFQSRQQQCRRAHWATDYARAGVKQRRGASSTQRGGPPSQRGQYLVGGIIIVAILMLIARPFAVFVCAPPDRRARWSFSEMLFMCWTRETGVIPAALAGLLLGMNAPGAQMIASVTFIAVLMTILIQAPTAKWLAKKLDLLEENKKRQVI